MKRLIVFLIACACVAGSATAQWTPPWLPPIPPPNPTFPPMPPPTPGWPPPIHLSYPVGLTGDVMVDDVLEATVIDQATGVTLRNDKNPSQFADAPPVVNSQVFSFQQPYYAWRAGVWYFCGTDHARAEAVADYDVRINGDAAGLELSVRHEVEAGVWLSSSGQHASPLDVMARARARGDVAVSAPFKTHGFGPLEITGDVSIQPAWPGSWIYAVSSLEWSFAIVTVNWTIVADSNANGRADPKETVVHSGTFPIAPVGGTTPAVPSSRYLPGGQYILLASYDCEIEDVTTGVICSPSPLVSTRPAALDIDVTVRAAPR